MWASHDEYMENWRSETFSPQEWEWYEQQRYEIEAENAWLYAAENSMEDCPDWAR